MRRFWNNLGITHKFSLTFMLMLGFIVCLCALSYGLLSITHRRTVNDIEMSYRIQNLVLSMDGKIEKARRIKYSFYLTYSKTTSVVASDESIAAQVGAQLAAVSEQSKQLKKLIARSNVSKALQQSHININLYYSIANRCITVFNELLELINRMNAAENGLLNQLNRKMAALQIELETIGDPNILTRFNRMQLHINEYLLKKQRPIIQSALNQAFYLKNEVRDSSFLKPRQKVKLLAQIEMFAAIAHETPQLDVMIQTKSRDFDLNTETLEPIARNLIQLAQKDVRRAQAENVRRVKIITWIFLAAAFSGVLWVGCLAYLIHQTITRHIVRLTHMASAFQDGNLGVRDHVDKKDELGHLSKSFNQMAARLQTLVSGLEDQVAARTRDLSESNHALKKEIAEHQATEKARVKLEVELRQIHKMEAIGTLAGGIAHDFNNILGIIMGNCELAMDDIPEWNPARANMEEIKTASHRARDIVRQLLSFSRKTEDEKQLIKLQTLVKETIALMRATIPTTIEIRTAIDAELGVIRADPSQIHQVIINLCTNAAHAMETHGGILEIHLKAIERERITNIPFKELKPGSYVQLTISDTGQGIDSTIIDKIFDPYFTTKEFGKGTGMGLSIVHGIITNHEGFVSVYSEPGQGTSFKVYLPLVDERPVREMKPIDVTPGGDEAILWVDDEDSILKMGQKTLVRLGYQVDTHNDPTEALKAVRSQKDKYDLIITDMTMPKMTGADLAQHILKIRPDMPIILSTGFSHKIDKERANIIGVREYIEKPLDKLELSMAVRRALDGA